MRLPLSWRIKRISFKHWLGRKWIDLKYRALDGWDGWTWWVRYLYDASPTLIAGQGIAAAVLISAGMIATGNPSSEYCKAADWCR